MFSFVCSSRLDLNQTVFKVQILQKSRDKLTWTKSLDIFWALSPLPVAFAGKDGYEASQAGRGGGKKGGQGENLVGGNAGGLGKTPRERDGKAGVEL